MSTNSRQRQSLNAFVSLLFAIVGLSISPSARADILYVADSYDNTIWKTPSTGTPILFASTGLDYTNAIPTGLAFDSAGNLYASSYGNNVVEKFSPSGTDLGAFVSTGLCDPLGIAFDSAGNLYVANILTNSTTSGGYIEKFSSTGVDLGTFAKYPDAGVSGPISLAFDSEGNLYVGNAGNGSIERFSSSGANLGAFVTGVDYPQSLTFDSEGNLYAVEANNDIEKFSSSGADLGNINSVVSDPTALAIDSAGNLYVASAYGGITEYSSTGTDLGTFASGFNGPSALAFTNDAGQPLVNGGPVPEPCTAALLVGGVGLLIRSRRRKA